MAEIKTYPLFRHLRAEPTSHVLDYRGGALRREGPGQAFWFRAINTAIAEVPIDDRELPFLFHVRSADFQALTVQGAITFRVVDPQRVARRIDFAIDLNTGRWTQTPLEQLAGLVMQLAQQFVIDELVKRELRTILADGVAPIRAHIAAGLAAEPALADLGIEVVAVRVAAVAPTSEMEKALHQPTREALQQDADEAFPPDSRHYLSDGLLTSQQGSAADLATTASTSSASGPPRFGAAIEDPDFVPPMVIPNGPAPAGASLLALALRELAGQLGQIEHLTITPDLLTPVLARLNR
jgi:hypothetical protein